MTKLKIIIGYLMLSMPFLILYGIFIEIVSPYPGIQLLEWIDGKRFISKLSATVTVDGKQYDFHGNVSCHRNRMASLLGMSKLPHDLLSYPPVISKKINDDEFIIMPTVDVCEIFYTYNSSYGKNKYPLLFKAKHSRYLQPPIILYQRSSDMMKFSESRTSSELSMGNFAVSEPASWVWERSTPMDPFIKTLRGGYTGLRVLRFPKEIWSKLTNNPEDVYDFLNNGIYKKWNLESLLGNQMHIADHSATHHPLVDKRDRKKIQNMSNIVASVDLKNQKLTGNEVIYLYGRDFFKDKINYKSRSFHPFMEYVKDKLYFLCIKDLVHDTGTRYCLGENDDWITLNSQTVRLFPNQ